MIWPIMGEMVGPEVGQVNEDAEVPYTPKPHNRTGARMKVSWTVAHQRLNMRQSRPSLGDTTWPKSADPGAAIDDSRQDCSVRPVRHLCCDCGGVSIECTSSVESGPCHTLRAV